MTSQPVVNSLRATALIAALATVASAQTGVGVLADRGSPTRAPYVHVFDPDTLRLWILDHADREIIATTEASEAMADRKAREVHPIWGHRASEIIEALWQEGWADGRA